MKQLDVYSHPVHGFEVVKNGFSWPGFFFTWIWMMLCRMWVGAVVVVGAYFVGMFVSEIGVLVLMPDADGHLMNAMDKAVVNDYGEVENADELTAAELAAYDAYSGVSLATAGVIGLIVNLIVGIKGNAWRRRAMATRGFKHLKSIQAQSAADAISKAKAAEETTDGTSP